MASPSEKGVNMNGRGARKRTTIINNSTSNNTVVVSSASTTRINNRTLTMNENSSITNTNDAEDSGLSSESTTPTGGSPPPRQQNITINNTTNHFCTQNLANSIAIRAMCERGRIGSGRTSRLLRSRSGTDSPRSLDSVRTRQVSSPLRPPRNIQSPSLDSGDEGSLRLERGTYQYMFQDIVSIKTMLLKLKRVLQESGENGLTRAETLNPFDNSMKNGLFYNLNEGGTTDASTSPGSGTNSVADELADLRRQVVFLQGQLEDRDRTIHLLQVQMTKYQGINGLDTQQCSSTTSSSFNSNDISKETCNAATQTHKIRPVSAGPSLLQSLPQDGNVGPLVRWNDLWNQTHPPPPTSSTVQNGLRTLRKPSDHSPRLVKSRQDQSSSSTTTTTTTTANAATSNSITNTRSSNSSNDYVEKQLADTNSIMMNNNKKFNKSTIKELSQNNRSSDLNSSCSNNNNNILIKEDIQINNKSDTIITTSKLSSIPMPRRLTQQQTLIPRAARAVSATGRSHNT